MLIDAYPAREALAPCREMLGDTCRRAGICAKIALMRGKIICKAIILGLALVPLTQAEGLVLPRYGALLAAGVPYLTCDGPDDRHAWAIHDRNRPEPSRVTATEGRPPSDAKILFDGTAESFVRNWRHMKADRAADWTVADGCIRCAKGAGYLGTKESFADCQLHIEWMIPERPSDPPRYYGNSGVYLMGTYEVQILDSAQPGSNYADGIAGAIYAQDPPLVNPTRAPGEWQSFDIVFHAPVWDGDVQTHPGAMTVFHNGVLVHDDFELEGPTTAIRRPARPERLAARLPLTLQDHGYPVAFRNIWIREIPSRHGPKADGMSQRRKTAAELFARLDFSDVSCETVNYAMEVLSYSDEPRFRAPVEKLMADYRAKVSALPDGEAVKIRREFEWIDATGSVLVRGGVMKEDHPFLSWIREELRRTEERR